MQRHLSREMLQRKPLIAAKGFEDANGEDAKGGIFVMVKILILDIMVMYYSSLHIINGLS